MTGKTEVLCTPDGKIIKENSYFTKWLDEVFYPAYRLRACIIAMTTLLKKMLDDDNIKKELLASNKIWTGSKSDVDRYSTIKNFSPEYIPFRLEDENKSSEILWHFISQVVVLWDKAVNPKDKDSSYPYFATMRIARNWTVHRIIASPNLQTECFLFGICLRGLFDFSNLKKTNVFGCDGYEKWEKELLDLMKKLDKYMEYGDEPSDLVKDSSNEILIRSNYKDERKLFIYNILDKMGHDATIERYEEDLLRAFLHGVYGVYDNTHEFFIKNSDAKDIQEEYLKAVKNRLKKAVDDAKKLIKKSVE